MAFFKSYRVISLLNYLRKTTEKIVATRSSYFATTLSELFKNRSQNNIRTSNYIDDITLVVIFRM